jgi:uncharacterized protein (DUF1684 family)
MNTIPQAWSEWIDSRNKKFANPTGFLSVTNLVWLTSEPQAIAGLTGSWWASGDTVHVKDSSSGEHAWTIQPRAEMTFDFDEIKVELASRAGQLVVRPRDPNSPMLKTFESVLTFDYDPSFRVKATLELNDAPSEVVVGSVVEGMTHAYVSPGTLVFKILGEECRLTAFNLANSENLNMHFKDETSGGSSYGGGRTVTATHQTDGSYIIDFNYSGNFPCAYTDFATCPLAPAENNLTVEIAAGEMKPIYRATADGIKVQVS